tara:strand:+ start:261 stop:380 length:120 start_codon:yes stop_codon:yes gene_type:complete
MELLLEQSSRVELLDYVNELELEIHALKEYVMALEEEMQ